MSVEYSIIIALSRIFLWCIVIAGGVSLFISLVEWQFRSLDLLDRICRNFGWLIAVSFPIALVAYFLGYVTSYSRSPAVGTVVPATLALIGGLNIYMFGTDSRHRGLVTYCVSLFALTLFYGTQIGAGDREEDRIARVSRLAAQEIVLLNRRKALGLSEEPPAWMLSTEPK
jgi:hypothetical protein